MAQTHTDTVYESKFFPTNGGGWVAEWTGAGWYTSQDGYTNRLPVPDRMESYAVSAFARSIGHGSPRWYSTAEALFAAH